MDLQRLKELYAAATPGPWLFDKDGEAGYGNYHGDENAAEWQRLFFTDELGAFRLADIELISALHAAFPAILKRLRAAEVAMAEVRDMSLRNNLTVEIFGDELPDGFRLAEACFHSNRDAIIADYEKAIK